MLGGLHASNVVEVSRGGGDDDACVRMHERIRVRERKSMRVGVSSIDKTGLVEGRCQKEGCYIVSSE